MVDKQGLELLKVLEHNYHQVDKLYGEFERVTQGQKEALIQGLWSDVARLVFKRHVVIEQVEARNAASEEVKQQLIKHYPQMTAVNLQNLTDVFGSEAVAELKDIIDKLQLKIEALMKFDDENKQLLQGKLLNVQKQRQHLQVGKQTLDAYKKKTPLEARYTDKER